MVTEKNALQVLTSPVLWVVKVVAWKWFSDIKNLDHDLDPLMSFHATGCRERRQWGETGLLEF